MVRIFGKKLSLIRFLLILGTVFCQYGPMDKEKASKIENYFLDLAQGKLSQQNFKKSETPKISVILPIHNDDKKAILAIRSIQNQSLKDIEIVVVNDNSNKETLANINKIKKNDPRIKIINNKIIRGLLYNRVQGALESQGEYVTFINGNGGLCDPDILKKAYEVATKKYKESIEVVHYQSCNSEVTNGKFNNFLLYSGINSNNFDKVIKDSEIGENYLQNGKNITNSEFVFDKIIKKQVIKRVSSYIGPHLWNQNITETADFLLAYAIMKKAKSFVNIADIGYWNKKEAKKSIYDDLQIKDYRLSEHEKSNKIIGDCILILERLLELTEEEKNSIEFRKLVLEKIKDEKFMKALARSTYYDKYINLCEKMVNWKYIDNPTKEKILNHIKYVLKFKVNPEKMFEYIIDEEDNEQDDDDDDPEYMINDKSFEL